MMRETTALGAAIAAGIAVGVWENLEEIEQVNAEGQTLFQPKLVKHEANRRFARWERAVEMCRGWEE